MPQAGIPSSLYSLAVFRLSVGLGQGAALYLLYLAYDERVWPATNGLIFAPLLLVMLLIPLLVIQASGNMRVRTLMLWTCLTLGLICGLGFYDIWHAWPIDWVPGENGELEGRPHITPSPQLLAALVAGFFISQSLVTGGDAERKIIASYPTYFDIAWKLAVQGALAVAFAGALWLLLFLGANLFELIDIDFFSELIRRRWFAIPATALAIAAAIHITDVRVGIVRGIRTLGLTLLSWLLPLMTLFVMGFLAALPFTGVQPLWDTQVATPILMAAVAMLLVLINATYQDGDGQRFIPGALRYPGTLAALTLTPLAVLAAIALGLRVNQYGWTADRFFAAAVVLVAGFHAAGYAVATLRRGVWLKRIERWNVYSALFVLAVLFALFTPIADPYRISVNSQMARLESGAVTPEEFDLRYLRWTGGRFGREALEQLAETDNNELKTRVEAALAETNRSRGAEPRQLQPPNIVVRFPENGALPDSFVSPQEAPPPIPSFCSSAEGPACEAFILDLNGDSLDEIVLISAFETTIFGTGSDGTWAKVGTWNLPTDCQSIKDALVEGRFQLVEPLPPSLSDIEIGGQRFAMVPDLQLPPCPQ